MFYKLLIISLLHLFSKKFNELLLTISDKFSQSSNELPIPFDPVAMSRTPERGQFPDLTEGFSVNHFTGQVFVKTMIFL